MRFQTKKASMQKKFRFFKSESISQQPHQDVVSALIHEGKKSFCVFFFGFSLNKN
jgi:high-affinity Fe2+/Pb2+ permease